MGMDPPPAPGVTPPVYNYSNEITGGTFPGGAVVRRDTTCSGTVTTTDNTKGHMWITAPLAAAMTLTGDAAMNLSTQTFNGVTADATICVALLQRPRQHLEPRREPADADRDGRTTTTTATPGRLARTGLAFTLDFLSRGGSTVPAGNRLGVRIWPASSSGADLVVLYDHPLHASFLQVNAE